MKYVYLVYDEIHGTIVVCGTPETATRIVNEKANSYRINPMAEFADIGDRTNSFCGRDVIYWTREEVIE